MRSGSGALPTRGTNLLAGVDLIYKIQSARSTPEQPSKTSETGHFGVLRSKSSDYCLNCDKNITILLPRRRKKNDKIHVLSIHFSNDHIFIYEYLSEPNRNDRKVSQYSVCKGKLDLAGADLI